MKRKGYEWPQVIAVHPDHGSYLVDVHGIQAENGHIVLIAFLSKNAPEQVRLVEKTAKGMGLTVVSLNEDDITDEIRVRLVAQFHANPGLEVVLAEVAPA